MAEGVAQIQDQPGFDLCRAEFARPPARAGPNRVVFGQRRWSLAIEGRELFEQRHGHGYRFDLRKLGPCMPLPRESIRAGQLAYEWRHQLRKLWRRDRARWGRERHTTPMGHPGFRVVPGGIEPWERPVHVSGARRRRAARPG